MDASIIVETRTPEPTVTNTLSPTSMEQTEPTVNATTFMETFPTGAIVASTYQVDSTQSSLSHRTLLIFKPEETVETLTTENDVDSSYPAWSPDCNSLAFIRSSETNGQRTVDIAILDVNSDDINVITIPAIIERTVRWSPSSDYLVFAARNNGTDQIYTLSLLTELYSQLTSKSFNLWPDWSPDGMHIVFVSERKETDPTIYVMNADGSGQSQLLPAFWGSYTIEDPGRFQPMEPKWSPNGKLIAFTVTESPATGLEYSRIYVVTNNGENPHPITDQYPENPYGDTLYYESNPVWSPDGGEILYIRSYEKDVGKWVDELCVASLVTGHSSCFYRSEENQVLSNIDWCS